jgi:Flp pilus assembly protein TadB
MTWSRAIAILVAATIMAILNRFAGLNGYASFVIGLLTYFVTRYVLWAIAERRRFKGEMEQFVKDYHDRKAPPP